ncbi:2-C-methyl-D-erythritol 4-phosphate cytidylyltransferase [Filimonas sp.]|jgi:2-C-methyl-D-erythritol 4-phosphate cytidylyltransferase|nr:2-C-methyl-D-erythritol 4-phosphate cytidylyltransferase [Filimonas sp.]
MKYAVIVAGGSGKRMNHAIPKQFILLEDKPILFYTVQKFIDFSPDLKVILVLPAEVLLDTDFVSTYLPDSRNIQTVAGGETRFHSVQNGLQAIEGEGIVFIHDGVRPFVSHTVLNRCLKGATEFGNAIPYIDLKDSIRQVNAAGNTAVPRHEYKAIQTPQTFNITDIKKAFEQSFDEHFTDEASVFEKAGHLIHLVEGNEENIKITTPQDLEVAKILLRKEKLLI